MAALTVSKIPEDWYAALNYFDGDTCNITYLVIDDNHIMKKNKSINCKNISEKNYKKEWIGELLKLFEKIDFKNKEILDELMNHQDKLLDN